MIRQLICVGVIVFITPLLYAQETDTLSNIPEGNTLYAPEYNGTGQWGYVLGQNSVFPATIR